MYEEKAYKPKVIALTDTCVDKQAVVVEGGYTSTANLAMFVSNWWPKSTIDTITVV